MEYDMEYLADIMSKMCGLPARIYKDGKKKAFFSQTEFPKDPADLLESSLSSCTESVGYVLTDDFFYYGYITYDSTLFLLGPARLIKADDSVIRKMALSLGIGKEDIPGFKNAMGSLIPLPLESMIQALVSLNYAVNHEKKTIQEILFKDNVREALREQAEKDSLKQEIPENDGIYEHNTYDIECNILRMVEHGETDELDKWLSNAPAVRGGVLSNDALRQMKNTFIATATLQSRAAIKGGMNVNEALSLSDLYIQKSELAGGIQEVSEIQLAMLKDYTSRVAKIRGKSDASPFLLSVNKYVYSHLSDAIKSEDICKSLFISRSVLFDKMKKETGKTVSEYILNLKINESKGLLKYSDRSIASISLYLGFSSQSHYNRTFREFTGMTPKVYRETHKK